MLHVFEVILAVVVMFSIMMIVLGMSKVLIPVNSGDVKDGWIGLSIGILIAIPIYMYFIN